MNKLLTIIIPVYNQEELVKKCLDSIPKKKDIEIICINDASQDNSLEILKTYKDITVLNNEFNEGPGYSRNLGLDAANGKYIMFLDSDDYMHTEAYAEMEELMLSDLYDMIFYNLETNNGHIVDVTKDNPKACGTIKVLRKEFIGKLRFPLISKAEDKYFHNWLLESQPRIYHSHINLVHYNYPREGSITDIFKKIPHEIKDTKNYKYLVEATYMYKKTKKADKELNKIPEEGEQWYVNKERLDKLTWGQFYNYPFVYVINREEI